MIQEISQFWTEEAFKHRSPATGRRYRGGYLSWNYWVAYAPSTAATPDGRRRGTFLSNGVCPVTGCDREGPTAAITSVGRLGLETAPNGASHTLNLSPSLLRDDEHVSKLAALLRVADALARGQIRAESTLRLTRAGDELVVSVSGMGDLLLEQRAIVNKGDLFEDVYGMRIRLEEA